MKTQAERIIDYIERRGAITAFDAQKDLGISRLAARMGEINKYRQVFTRTIVVENRFGQKCRVTEYSFMRDATAMTPDIRTAPTEDRAGQQTLILDGEIRGPKGG